MSSESLSFTLRPAETYDDLMLACRARAEAYGHKDPKYLKSMAEPDAIDLSPWTAVFLCEDKASGRPVGSVRIQTTTRGDTQLEIEKYVEPPAEYLDFGRAEVSRLSAVHGGDPFIRMALWKASYLYCKATQVGALIVGVRKPALIRAYTQMGFKDIYADRRYVPLGHGGPLPYRVMLADVLAAERFWYEENPLMLRFMSQTIHPDLAIVPSVHRAPVEQVRLRVV
ncbi:MAG TPA: hypothetical protein VNS61_18235 [Caldimonas sp.]|nr:hypothetical protein [Caldimonas sp.]